MLLTITRASRCYTGRCIAAAPASVQSLLLRPGTWSTFWRDMAYCIRAGPALEQLKKLAIDRDPWLDENIAMTEVGALVLAHCTNLVVLRMKLGSEQLAPRLGGHRESVIAPLATAIRGMPHLVGLGFEVDPLRHEGGAVHDFVSALSALQSLQYLSLETSHLPWTEAEPLFTVLSTLPQLTQLRLPRWRRGILSQ